MLPKKFLLSKSLVLLLISLAIFSISVFTIRAVALADDTQRLQELSQQEKQLMNDLNAAQAKDKTLQNQINYMENQIKLTQVKIDQAQTSIRIREEELIRLTGDIGLVSGKIDLLGKTLEQQKDVFSARVATAYKNGQTSILEMFLGSADFSYFINRFKYLQVFESNDNKYLLQMEGTRKVFQTQKIILADKKDQVQTIKNQIEQQKASLEKYNNTLVSQKKAQQNLLAETQKDEKRYQELLSQVRTEMNAIRGFVSLRGGASILTNQTVCNDWGCYYNQRDSSWGTRPLGASSLSMAEYGCLVSSSAMIATHYKRNLNPEDIASNPSAFFSPDVSTAYLWKDITVNGVRINRTDLSVTTGSIDAELSAGRPVIVGLYRGPAHFIVLKSGSNGDYIMNDPFVENGHDVNFNSKYPLSAITNVERVDVY